MSIRSLAAVMQQPLVGDDVAYLHEHYTKRETLIPMRDGVRLHTVIYIPKDQSKTYPFLLNRTPYSAGPYGEEYRQTLGPSMLFAREGYIFAYQDVRGRYLSEGNFVAVRPHLPVKHNNADIDESSDTYDTIDWLLNNIPNHNGKAGSWGISAPGFYATMTAIDAHPAMKAVSPQAPVTDWFMGDDRHHNGAFFLMGTFSFLSYFGKKRPEPTAEHATPFSAFGTPDAYEFYKNIGPIKNLDELYFKGENMVWNEMMDNPDYTYFWQSRSPVPHLKNIKPAVLTVGGWFDQEDLYGPLKTFAALEKNDPIRENHLVMGPWTHGSWTKGDNDYLGDIRFYSNTGPYYRKDIELAFFNHHLKGLPTQKLPKAMIFETGSNQWKAYSSWPPETAKEKSLYLHANGKISFHAPSNSNSSEQLAEKLSYREYLSDPDNPVPYTKEIRNDRGRDFMYEDQRFAASRPDVLVYQTDLLEDDIVVSGNLLANLFVSTTGTDADFIVKLIDVYPGDAINDSPNPTTKMGGFQLLVRGEVMRSKYRNSFIEPQEMIPGEIAEVKFDMQDAAHCFRKGHRLMVQIQSSWFPLVDRNPQTFVDIYKASEADFQKAIHRIYSSADKPSHLKLHVLRGVVD